MNRREWLFGATAAALTLPLFVRQALAYGPICLKATERQKVLRDALAGAAKAGKPLLVLMAPNAAEGAWVRLLAFGEWLNHGGEPALADLARVHVACGSTQDLRAGYERCSPIEMGGLLCPVWGPHSLAHVGTEAAFSALPASR